MAVRRILRTPEAAEYVGLAESTLEKQRVAGVGPRFIRLGSRAIGYDIRDLDAWLDGHRESPAAISRTTPVAA
jgi:predicted DNA-binding transcriptional regulator AlpA